MDMRNGVLVLLILATSVARAQGTSPETIAQAYATLSKESVWIHPQMKDRIEAQAAKDAVEASKTFPIKLLIVPELGAKWRSGSTEKRGAYGRWLFTQQLKLKDGALIVGTKHGITAYSNKISEKRLVQLNNQASKLGSSENLTPAVQALSASLLKETKATTQTTTTQAAPKLPVPQPEAGPNFAWFLCPAVLIGGFGWVVLAGRKQKMTAALRRAEGYRDRAVNSIAYLDSYADLLPHESDQRAITSARDKANKDYESGLALMRLAKTPADLDGANLKFETAVESSQTGRKVIEAATGGTDAAFAISPTGYDDADDPRVYQPVKNVCFFCSKPGKGDLTPVTVNVKGQRQTVLVCGDDLAVIKSGRAPDVRGEQVNGKFVPWYGMRDYDPNRDYDSRSSLWDTFALMSMVDMMRPHDNVYVQNGGGWWDTPQPEPSHSSSLFDFGGGNFDSSSDTSSFDSGGGSFDSGSFDSGGGSFDSGGGSDSGGGGGDF